MVGAANKRLYIGIPHGFCAGVRRAVAVVEAVLAAGGSRRIFVFNEIVHNNTVVDELRKRGVAFIRTVSEAEDGSILVFSAHGVGLDVMNEAARRDITVIDATCPLVTALHAQARKLAADGRRILLIGKPGHPEIIGTLGQLPDERPGIVVPDAAAAAALPDLDGLPAVLTQTTLNNAAIGPVLTALKRRFGTGVKIANHHCYATENRQNAVKMLAEKCELVLIIGSPHSSNSKELCKVAENSGCRAKLIDTPEEIAAEELSDIEALGLTAGASAPPELFDAAVRRLARLGFTDRQTVTAAEEKVDFPLPPININ